MRENSWSFADGDRITDDLTAVRLLGGGEIYEAYLAFDDITYGFVVAKVLRPGRVRSNGALTGLRREIEALERLNHPVLVRLLRASPEAERPHLVLEHIEGPRLSSLLRRHGPLQEHQYLPLAVELASVLHFLRYVGYVHLDVKPSNVIMGSPARLIDLSVARTLELAESLDHSVGTDDYMAPEQVEPPKRGRPGPASDVWGVGATLYHAIEGVAPFDGDHRSEVVAERWPQVENEAPPFSVRVRPDVAAVVRSCLARDPAARPQPQELAESLEAALTDLPKGKLSFKVR
jgi:serine/threonine protein kinase